MFIEATHWNIALTQSFVNTATETQYFNVFARRFKKIWRFPRSSKLIYGAINYAHPRILVVCGPPQLSIAKNRGNILSKRSKSYNENPGKFQEREIAMEENPRERKMQQRENVRKGKMQGKENVRKEK